MDIKVKLPSMKKYEQFPEVAKSLVIPFLVRNASFLQNALKRRWRSGKGTDGEKDKKLPPYSKQTKEVREELGLSKSPDYIRSKALINSLTPSVLQDKRSGGVKLIVSPKGRHLSTKGKRKDQQKAALKGGRIVRGKFQADPQSTTVKVTGKKYKRRAYSYKRNGKTVRVPKHFVGLPPEDIGQNVDAKTSRSGWWFFVWYQQELEARTGKAMSKKRGKRVPFNRDLAFFLARRLGRGRWGKGRVRLNPFIQFGKKERKTLARRYSKEVLPKLAGTLNI